jgi:hypothetical protein
MRYAQLTLAGLTTATLFLGCEDSTTSRQAKTLGVTDPAMTMAVGFTSTTLARGNAGTFHISSNANGFNVQVNSQDNTDFVDASIVITSGGTSGWHSHPGPVIVVVKTGTVTFYRARAHGDDNAEGGTCSRTDYPAGSAFFETGGQTVEARNEGGTDATVFATYFVPAGQPTRIDQPAPGGNCPA